MEINKEKYFKDGYISNVEIFDQKFTDNIYNQYLDYLKKDVPLVDKIEHKTKTHLYFSWANEIIFNEKILDSVEKILGPNFFCWNSLIFHKYPKSKTFVSMHQDQNYWKIIHDKALSIQIAISESNKENGCLKLLPGSHKKNLMHHDYIQKNNLLARGQSVSNSDFNEQELIDIELKPGNACIFHGNILHGSKPNKSNNHRLLFTIRYLTTDNKIDTKYYYNYGTLVRGIDDYNFFRKEEKLNNSNVNQLNKLHKKLILDQLKNYINIKIRFDLLSNIIYFLLSKNFFRNIYYKIIKKV